MKILVIPSWYPPFGGRFFKYQAEELAKLGHNVDVLVLHEIGINTKVNKKIDSSKSKFITEIKHNYYRIPKLNNLNIKYFIKKYKKLVNEYLKKNDVDIIHVHSAIWAGVVVSKIAKNKNIPYVITEHRSVFLNDELLYSKNLKQDIKYAFDNAKSIISVSAEMKTKLLRFTNTRMDIIPNMVNTNVFIPLKEISKNKEFTFISVGNFSKVKAYDVLIKAFNALTDELKNIRLVLIGKGEDEKELQKLTSDKISFLAYKTINELVVEYNKAHVFVSSSRKETFGLAMIEAMSCGLPVLATKTAGAKDIVNNENGLFCEINCINDLSTKMKEIYLEYNKFESKIIRNNIITKYSFELVAKKIETNLLSE